jgi:hypothetical protein
MAEEWQRRRWAITRLSRCPDSVGCIIDILSRPEPSQEAVSVSFIPTHKLGDPVPELRLEASNRFQEFT